VAKKIEDKAHQEKIITAYNGIKEMGPQVVRAAKRAFENPKNVDIQQELHVVSKTLVAKISYAISVAQSDGGKVQNEISISQPTIPITIAPISSEEDPRASRRRRTVVEPTVGVEILSRARTATVQRAIEDDIEQASLLRIKNAESTLEPNADVSIEEESEEKAEKMIVNMESELASNDRNSSGAQEWIIKYEELQRETAKLRQDNELLIEENVNLNKVIENMKKRMALR